MTWDVTNRSHRADATCDACQSRGCRRLARFLLRQRVSGVTGVIARIEFCERPSLLRPDVASLRTRQARHRTATAGTAMTSRKLKAGDKDLSISGTLDVFAESRYVWVFQCSERLALHAATLDRSGPNLPNDPCGGGAWTLTGQLIVGPENRPSVGIDIGALKAGITKNGFYLWNADMEPLPDTLRLMR